MTLIDTIIFRRPADAEDNVALWAHELKHVQQYQQLGVEEFARRYTRNYDDLEARVDLPAARLKVFKDNNILYDRDADGEYLQAYTRSFKDLFFIELVQRRGYKGFGAINASIRLNAQSRLAAGATTSEF